jgi:hypothetical protein
MPNIKVKYSVKVKSEAKKLWDIITNLQSWPEWQGTSYIKPFKIGLLKKDSEFIVELNGFKWKLKVIKAQKPKSISWTGHRIGLGCTHSWEFIEENDYTEVVTWEEMHGWLLYFTYPVIKKMLQKYDYNWLIKLKLEAEKLSY